MLDGRALLLAGVLLGALELVRGAELVPPCPVGTEPIGATEVADRVGVAAGCRPVLVDTACPGSTGGLFDEGSCTSTRPPAVRAAISAAAATGAPINGPAAGTRGSDQRDFLDRLAAPRRPVGGIGGTLVAMKAVASSGCGSAGEPVAAAPAALPTAGAGPVPAAADQAGRRRPVRLDDAAGAEPAGASSAGHAGRGSQRRATGQHRLTGQHRPSRHAASTGSTGTATPSRSVRATSAALGRSSGSIAVIACSSSGHGCGRPAGISGERSSRASTASSAGPS